MLNLPSRVEKTATPEEEFAGFDYTFGGEKIRKAASGGAGTTERLYLGGAEFFDGEAESFYHPEGRVVFDNTFRFQYKLTDHLGNTVVLFEDKNGNGEILENADPELSEVLQRHYYYPFGMQMEGLWNGQTAPGMRYLYNGKELEEDLGLGWYAYGFRYYDASIGRFTGVDPISDQFAWVSVYNYAENEPVGHIDLHGLQATRYEMQQDRKFGSAAYKNMSSEQRLAERSEEAKIVSTGLLTATALGVGAHLSGTAFNWAITYPVTAMEVGASGGAVAVGLFDEGNQVQLPGLFDDGGRIAIKSLKTVPNPVPDMLAPVAAKGGSQILNTTTRQLQAKFKHAADFGVTGSWNKAAAGRFNSAINQHINSAGVKTINGTYRGQSVIHHLNPNTGLNVISSPSGQFISGWKLNPAQLQNVLKHGGL